MGQYLLPPLLPHFVSELGITPAKAGFAVSAVIFVGSLSQYPGGRLSDQLSRKTLLVAGIVSTGLGVTMFGFAHSYPVFLAGAVATGIGVGLYPPAAYAHVSELFEKRRGRAIGILTGAANLGGAIAAGVVIVIPFTQWRWAFGPAVTTLLIVGILFHNWGREPYRLKWTRLHFLDTGRRLLHRTRLLGVLAVYALFSFSAQGTLAFIPSFLVTQTPFSTTLAQTSYGAIFVIGVGVKPLVGEISDFFNRRALLIVAMGCSGIGLGGLLVFSSIAVVGVSMVTFSIGLMGFTPLLFAHLSTLLSAESQGGDFGAIRGVATSIGSFGPITVGLVATHWSYTAAFAGVTALFLLGMVTIALANV